ncbi:hypothetical protein Moror_15316 [Moniliophthora roreri MCA 2997]|uniref:EKC/KEOPS complex subunit CGI121 n=2 Tax=Moniliophthora roreri TaxID=221103 RepID=V2WLV0_MONRO|nr:hypothetical protein Moror_15316 [Moniliophthora roreri MCA 2997]KAI3603642.1 hypothetical protein WG66_006032 [Moniliophthora roreri]
MQSLAFDHADASDIAYVALFHPVNNAAQIRKRIIDAAKMEGEEGEKERNAVNFAFIDATLITSVLHLQTVIHQAILAESEGMLRTKTVHSEVIFALNPTNNITESIRRYGVSDSSRALLVVHITKRSQTHPVSEIEKNLSAAIDGVMVPLSELDGLTDWDRVKKYHKLNNLGENQLAYIDNIVVSSAAMKSVMQ